jgi:cob(I)alamin adenosyltransferase
MAQIAENPERVPSTANDLSDRAAVVEQAIDDVTTRLDMPTDLVVPARHCSARTTDAARAAARSAQRSVIRAGQVTA